MRLKAASLEQSDFPAIWWGLWWIFIPHSWGLAHPTMSLTCERSLPDTCSLLSLLWEDFFRKRREIQSWRLLLCVCVFSLRHKHGIFCVLFIFPSSFFAWPQRSFVPGIIMGENYGAALPTFPSGNLQLDSSLLSSPLPLTSWQILFRLLKWQLTIYVGFSF